MFSIMEGPFVSLFTKLKKKERNVFRYDYFLFRLINVMFKCMVNIPSLDSVSPISFNCICLFHPSPFLTLCFFACKIVLCVNLFLYYICYAFLSFVWIRNNNKLIKWGSWYKKKKKLVLQRKLKCLLSYFALLLVYVCLVFIFVTNLFVLLMVLVSIMCFILWYFITEHVLWHTIL